MEAARLTVQVRAAAAHKKEVGGGRQGKWGDVFVSSQSCHQGSG